MSSSFFYWCRFLFCLLCWREEPLCLLEPNSQPFFSNQPPLPPTTPQLLLRWAAERGTPALVAATTPAHAAAVAAAADGWTLPPAVRVALNACDTGARFHRPDADWPDAEVGGALKPSLVL